MANSGGLPAGGSVLTLSTKVSKGIGLGPRDRDLDEGLSWH